MASHIHVLRTGEQASAEADLRVHRPGSLRSDIQVRCERARTSARVSDTSSPMHCLLFAELRRFAQMMGLNDEATKEMFNSMDVDRSESISQDEWCSFWLDWRSDSSRARLRMDRVPAGYPTAWVPSHMGCVRAEWLWHELELTTYFLQANKRTTAPTYDAAHNRAAGQTDEGLLLHRGQ